MYAILKAQSTNVGDNLIFESCKNIIRKVNPKAEFLEFIHNHNFIENLDELNSFTALIIPHLAIRNEMWPEIYRLVDDLKMIKIPIVSIGTGAKEMSPILIKNHKKQDDFDPTKTNINFSNSINELFSNVKKPISARDNFTQTVLQKNNFTDVVLTGDPAWYDFEQMEKSFMIPEKINRISFTTPHAPWMMEQAKSIISLFEKLWPQGKLFCCLHSGKNLEDQTVADFAQSQGHEIKILKSTKDLEFYKTCDIHLGYRLHAHIYNLRNHIPSWLIYEDARGWAFDQTINNKIGFNGLKVPKNKILHFLYHKGRMRHFAVKENIVNEIQSVFKSNEIFNEFENLNGFFARSWKKNMEPYLQKMLCVEDVQNNGEPSL